jgi:hypothetical protein
MPSQWAADLYDYDAEVVKHPDVASLDVSSGKWWTCK